MACESLSKARKLLVEARKSLSKARAPLSMTRDRLAMVGEGLSITSDKGVKTTGQRSMRTVRSSRWL